MNTCHQQKPRIGNLHQALFSEKDYSVKVIKRNERDKQNNSIINRYHAYIITIL